MNEYKKDRPTSEQLVDLLDNKLETTICADVVHGLDYEYKQLQQENKKLKNINKEYERLNKENNRGFKITNVQKYNIDELLSYKKYKDNWNNIKRFLQEKDSNGYEKLYIEDILEVMEKLERQGNETNKSV